MKSSTLFFLKTHIKLSEGCSEMLNKDPNQLELQRPTIKKYNKSPAK